eukprot:gene15714-17299_t
MSTSSPNNQGLADDENGPVVKTAKQLKNEAKKQAKLEKFAKKKLEQQQKQGDEKPSKPKQEKVKVKSSITYNISTEVGEKKDTSCELPDSYSPLYVESTWYSWWEKQGFFKPEFQAGQELKENEKGKFVICIPPPNVTGNLHLGHALMLAIEDAVTRWHRMHGKTTLWNPGCDHAGIATQVVVERKLKREQGISRHDIGREKFVDEVWKWKNEKGGKIYDQFRRMGVSVDWDRACFTMDDKLSRAVKETFVRLHDAGLIYRANRLVNWSCALNSAISDIEVDKTEISKRTFMSVPSYEHKVEFGVLIHFAYQIEGTDEKIVVATTRIETMLGDTGIAVHPSDARYKHLDGKFAIHPFCNRKLRIVFDEAVDPEFGTGAVKITPAHDHNDFEIGKRHDLSFIQMMDEGGLVKDVGDFKPEYQYFIKSKRFDARKTVLQALKDVGLYIKTEDNAMVIPVCSRSKDIVEPLLKPQWYVDCREMAENAVNVVRSGELKIIPSSHEKTWFSWMENCRDWCISRQLWWGHRIPAYFVTIQDGDTPPGNDADDKYWVSGRSEEEARENAAKKFNVSKEKIHLRQDDDVLDTWFSSAIFPFSIFGWPDQTKDLQAFYPTTLLETGHDILFFWVARMVMFGQKLTGQLPFKEIYLHAMVRDAHGRKMSKSLGNIIDPVDVITGISLENLHKQLIQYNLEPKEMVKAQHGQKEDYPHGIPECGTDALRFALCAYTGQGRDVNLDVLRVQGYRRFCNKIWNATKFAMKNLGADFKPKDNEELIGNESIMDQWILSRLSSAVDAANIGFESYDFVKTTTAIYNFWLYDLCDVYLESLKPVFSGGDAEAMNTARNVLYPFNICLILLANICDACSLPVMSTLYNVAQSPFMPFITEELFQRLPTRNSTTPLSVCVADYPHKHDLANRDVESKVDLMMEIVKTVRSIKEEYLTTKAKADVYLRPHFDDVDSIVNLFLETIKTLTSSSNLHLLKHDDVTPNGCAVALVGEKCEVYLHIKGLVDIDKEIAKLEKKLSSTESQLCKLIEAMGIEDYDMKVPENVRKQNNEKSTQLTTEAEKIKRAIANLKEAAN